MELARLQSDLSTKGDVLDGLLNGLASPQFLATLNERERVLTHLLVRTLRRMARRGAVIPVPMGDHEIAYAWDAEVPEAWRMFLAELQKKLWSL